MLSILKPFDLSPLERDVIGILRLLRKGTARKILKELNKNRNTELPYTTVASVLKRLHSGNLVSLEEEKFRGKHRKRYVYIYKDIESNYIDNILESLLETFGKGSAVHLAERLTHTSISDEDMKLIRKRLGIK